MKLLAFDPTPCFTARGDALEQRVRVTVESERGERAVLRWRAGDVATEHPLELAPGVHAYPVDLPDLRREAPGRVELWQGDARRDALDHRWRPQRHWEVHLTPYAHHDLGYTDLPSRVLREHDDILAAALELIDATAEWPEASRFRYQVEGAWSLLHFLEREPGAAARVARAAQAGRLEVSPLYGNVILELCSHETFARLLQPAFDLRRRLGVPLGCAHHNDIPGLPWGLPSLLAAAGLRRLATGVPGWYHGRGERRERPPWRESDALPLDRPAACWWRGPDGARVLLWNDLHGLDEWIPFDLAEAEADLPARLGALERAGYPYDLVRLTLRGAHRDNAPPILLPAEFARAWNATWAFPRLVVGTTTPFLRAFEARYGARLPELRGDVPGTDYPVAATSTPRETAVGRATGVRLPTAEAFATLSAQLTGAPFPRRKVERAHHDLRHYLLHCWGAAHPAGATMDAHWSEKRVHADRAAALAYDVLVKATNRLADEVRLEQRGPHLVVFNPLPWSRDAAVRAPLRPWEPPDAPFHVRPPDAAHPHPKRVPGGASGRKLLGAPAALVEAFEGTEGADPARFDLIEVEGGRAVPWQLIEVHEACAPLPWAPERVALGEVDARHRYDLAFVAEGLPAFGYRSYRLVPRRPVTGDAPEPPGAGRPAVRRPVSATGTGPLVLETDAYRLEIDRARGGASLLHRPSGHDLLAPSAAHALGQVVIRSSASGALDAAVFARAEILARGPVRSSVRLHGAVRGCPAVTLDLTLHHARPRLDVDLRLLLDATPLREVYVALPVATDIAADASRIRLETPWSRLDPARDLWPGAHDTTFAVGRWLSLAHGERTVVVAPHDTPVVCLDGPGPLPVSPAHRAVPPGGAAPTRSPASGLYALVADHNFRTNFVNAYAGETLARFSLRHVGPGDADATLGAELAQPPAAVWLDGPQEGRLPVAAALGPFDGAEVEVLALKPADAGDGVVLRLREPHGRRARVRLPLPFLGRDRALRSDLAEERRTPLPRGDAELELALEPFEVVTLRFE